MMKLQKHGVSFAVSLSPREQFESTVRKPYLTAVIDHLHSRFPCNNILDSFVIFDPKLLPQEDEELLQYGNDKLECLLQHYSDGPLQIDSDKCRVEWNMRNTPEDARAKD